MAQVKPNKPGQIEQEPNKKLGVKEQKSFGEEGMVEYKRKKKGELRTSCSVRDCLLLSKEHNVFDPKRHFTLRLTSGQKLENHPQSFY